MKLFRIVAAYQSCRVMVAVCMNEVKISCSPFKFPEHSRDPVQTPVLPLEAVSLHDGVQKDLFVREVGFFLRLKNERWTQRERVHVFV